MPKKHPGDILRDQIMVAEDLNMHDIVDRTGLPLIYVSGLMMGLETINVQTAQKLAYGTDTTAQFWLNAQKAYDEGD